MINLRKEANPDWLKYDVEKRRGNLMSPIEIEYQRDLNKAIALFYLENQDKPETVTLTKQDLATLYYNVKDAYDASKGKITRPTFDIVNGVSPKKALEKSDTVLISSKLYQGFKELEVKKYKLEHENKLLKHELHLLKGRLALMKNKQ